MIMASAIYWLVGLLWLSICIETRCVSVEPDTGTTRALFIVIGGAVWPLIFGKLCWDVSHGRNKTDF